MSWLTIEPKALWKIKPRWHIRWAEQQRQVRVVDLGLVLTTWWPNEDLNTF